VVTELVVGDVWARLIRTRRKGRRGAWVAVAYFGKGAARLLSLQKGSQLVVDASDNAVKSGLTCPNDLIVLLKKGVRIFSVANLHAKVYVFGTTALIGSANASRHSAQTLVEAMLLTTDRRVVEKSKAFVQSIAKNELGPEQLRRLQKLYRPPRRHLGGARRKNKPQGARVTASLPPMRLVRLVPATWSERDWAEHDVGTGIAQRRREHRRSWKLDDFQWFGAPTFQRGEKIVRVTRKDSGQTRSGVTAVIRNSPPPSSNSNSAAPMAGKQLTSIAG
jgi:PLD-like domain